MPLRAKRTVEGIFYRSETLGKTLVTTRFVSFLIDDSSLHDSGTINIVNEESPKLITLQAEPVSREACLSKQSGLPYLLSILHYQ